MLLPSIFLAFLYCVSAVDDLTEYRCPFTIHVKKGQIIRAKESLQNGAKFLKHTVVADARECYKLCCERESCDLALMQYANSSNPKSYLPVEKVCYMFHCGKPTKCRFGEHKHYATISYVRPNEQLFSLDDNPSQNAKSTTYRPSDTEGSDEDEEEEDLGYKSYQSHSRQKTQEIQQNKNLHSSWKTKFEGTNSGYSNKEFGKSIYHSKTANKPAATKNFKEYEQPVYQEVDKEPENPTKLVEVKTKASVLPFERIPLEHNKPKVSVGSDEGDADLEVKVEELTPSRKPVSPLPTFHHWREFVDNNPNFPYTIPLNYERNTQKPTRKKWVEAPRTEHPTRRKITTRKVVKTDPIKATEKTTTEKLTTITEKIKTTEKARIQEKNNLPGQGAYTEPPMLQLPLPKQNVSDVVVIETQRLRIIENKAVLPLAIFLVLAIVLLFVVALRLRIVKSKLKRRPFATDDADYLINGMYL